MRTYNCYLLDAQGHVASARVIECFDDGEASLRTSRILAEKASDYIGAEVWELHRCVGFIRAEMTTDAD
jgi:hypothetical protein